MIFLSLKIYTAFKSISLRFCIFKEGEREERWVALVNWDTLFNLCIKKNPNTLQERPSSLLWAPGSFRGRGYWWEGPKTREEVQIQAADSAPLLLPGWGCAHPRGSQGGGLPDGNGHQVTSSRDSGPSYLLSTETSGPRVSEAGDSMDKWGVTYPRGLSSKVQGPPPPSPAHAPSHPLWKRTNRLALCSRSPVRPSLKCAQKVGSPDGGGGGAVAAPELLSQHLLGSYWSPVAFPSARAPSGATMEKFTRRWESWRKTQSSAAGPWALWLWPWRKK